MKTAIAGAISNMVPATLISRHVEEATGIDVGAPVQQGSSDRFILAGVTADSFVGITVRSQFKEYEQRDEARVMTEGVIWVKAKAAVNAGDDPVYDGGWTNTGVGKPKLTQARYDTSGAAGELVQIRLWGTNAAAA